MSRICDIAQQVVMKGYLSLEDERKLRSLLSKKYDLDDFKAFMNLQWAVMDGRVKQESLEQIRSCYLHQPTLFSQ
ncbi:MAG: hypothetical protein WBA13_22900 [Microcoleaceae cyanobacterium]